MSGKCPYHNTNKPTLDVASSAQQQEASSSSSNSANNTDGGKAWNHASSDELKQHFIKAYNQVADCARNSSEHNYQIAKVLGEQLGYSEEELAVIGDDVWMMQGTGNPHSHVEVQPGEFVVDLGSGFGLDAFVAASKAGPTGRVVGIDLASKEVLSAIERCNQRGLRNVDFRLGDIENPPFDNGVVDVIISNGGVCLVQDKFKAFKEMHRILKPGGRLALSLTVRTKVLDDDKKWPSCFVSFASIETILPWLDEIGFTQCFIDRSNADVDIWELSEHHGNATIKENKDLMSEKNDDENLEQKKKPQESKCPYHNTTGGDASAGTASSSASSIDPKTGLRKGSGYEHLKDMVMSEYFQRVTIVAKKPLTSEKKE